MLFIVFVMLPRNDEFLPVFVMANINFEESLHVYSLALATSPCCADHSGTG